MIILASGSPRRRELLEMLGAEFEVCPAQGDEIVPPGLSPEETVKALALAKAEEIFGKRPDGLILAADTVVELDGEILGKPRDEADARRMLSAMSGRSHRVFTGIAAISGTERIVESEETEVTFRPLGEREIFSYVAGGEPMDKAGAYGVQGLASLFVERINGDFFNVMGLPLCRVGRILSRMGVDLI